MNITDVEDKIIRDAAASNKTIFEFTPKPTPGFLDDTAGAAWNVPSTS